MGKKIILIEKKAPTQEILNILKEIRSKKEKPFFDDKTQLDLNCLWISSLVAANEILPEMKYLKLAEEFFLLIEKNLLKTRSIIVIQKKLFF